MSVLREISRAHKERGDVHTKFFVYNFLTFRNDFPRDESICSHVLKRISAFMVIFSTLCASSGWLGRCRVGVLVTVFDLSTQIQLFLFNDTRQYLSRYVCSSVK